MAVSHVQKIGSASDNSASSFTITPASATTLGNAIIVQVVWYRTSGTFPNCVITDSQSNVYLTQYLHAGTTGNVSMGVYICPSAKSLSTGQHITVTFSGGSGAPFAVGLADEFSDLSATQDVAVVEATGTGTAATFGTLTTSTAGDLVLVNVGCQGNLGATTWSSDWTNNEFQTASPTISMAYQIASSTGSYSGTATLGTSETWRSIVLAFKAADASGLTLRQAALGKTSSNSTSTTTTFPVAPVSGNTIIVTAGSQATATNSITVSDNASNTYHRAVSVVDSNSSEDLEIWYASSVAATNPTITSSWSTSGGGVVIAYEYGGIATSSVVDVTGTATGTTTAMSVSATTTNANDLIIGAGLAYGSSGPTISSTNTNWAGAKSGGTGTTLPYVAMQDNVVSATGSQTMAMTASATPVNWAMGVVAFEASATGPTTYNQSVSGGLSFTGPSNLTNAISKGISGGLSFAGSITKNLNRALSGSLSFSGTFTAVRVIIKNISGTLSFTGPTNLIKTTAKILTAGLSFSGAIMRAVTKTMTSTLSFTGALTSLKVFVRSFSGSLGFSGSFTKRANKHFTAGLSFSGLLVKGSAFNRSLTATLSFSGGIAKTIKKNLAAATLTFTGSFTKAFSKALAASLSFSGGMVRSINKHMTATLSPSGLLLQGRAFIRSLTASLSFSGSVTSAKLIWTAIKMTVFGSSTSMSDQSGQDIVNVSSSGTINSVTSGIQTDEIQSSGTGTTVAGSGTQEDV